MKQIDAAKLNAQCLALLDDLDDEGILITNRDKPVAKLIPIRAGSHELIGSLRGQILIHGEILSTSVVSDAQPISSVVSPIWGRRAGPPHAKTD